MIESDNKTVWCGNLPEQVTEEILYELFLQAGPLERVRIAKDRDGHQKNFAFITFCHEVSVPYAINLFRGTTLYNRKLTLQSRGRMVLLPPPIRCYGPDANIDFSNQSAVVQNFTEMSESLRGGQQLRDQQQRDGQHLHEVQQLHQEHQLREDLQLRDIQHSNFSRKHDRNVDLSNDKLVMASLQGHWSHRHHPYRSNEQLLNRDYRSRDNNRNRDKPSANWKDRRHNRKSNYRR